MPCADGGCVVFEECAEQIGLWGFIKFPLKAALLQQMVCDAAAVLHLFTVVCEMVMAVFVKAVYALAGERGGAGDVMKVAVDGVLHAF